jgi:hypothetical protein
VPWNKIHEIFVLILGWKKVGSIEVAQTKDRLISLKRKIAMLQ